MLCVASEREKSRKIIYAKTTRKESEVPCGLWYHNKLVPTKIFTECQATSGNQEITDVERNQNRSY